MKKNPASQSGIFNLRTITACAFFCVGSLLSYFSFAGPTTPTNTSPTASAPSYSIHMSPPGIGDSWGEPSIGVNWNTEQTFNGTPNGGTVMTYGGFGKTALRITFNDTDPAAPAATWEKTVTLPLASQPRAVGGDPILFTDHETGRTFVSQLQFGTPASTTDVTNDDGHSYTESQGSGIASGIDHQTFGGGPFAPPLTGSDPLYKNAVYYCSQDVGDALCALSVDGGTTFGPAVPIFTIADCAGLHGHIKVSPKDGAAYVPDKGCGGSLPFHDGSKQAVIISENNGVTWQIRPVTTSTGNGIDTKSDPSVGVATDGTLYFGYQNNDGHPHIAVSTDKGATWGMDTDVGAALGINNTAFPAVVAGDPDRAAFAFFGTTTDGTDFNQPAFTGVWYLFIATTYDGGQTWTTVNPNPNDPIQRGGICDSGTCRNLLDYFDATIDKEGRLLVGYDDGCITTGCVQGTSGNNFTSKNAIARQLDGRRLFAAFDISLSGVVSEKTHGTAGTFDINLPLTGTRGVECRSGGANGDHTLVFTFPNPLTSVGGASVTGGTGSVSSGAIGADTHQYIVNLTGVANAQYITVSLTNVHDVASHVGDVSGTMGVLLGDTTANGSVNSSDISQTKAQSGTVASASNFRTDVTINGLINSSDISTVKSKSGTALPSLP
jgi:hypothetical protein